MAPQNSKTEFIGSVDQASYCGASAAIYGAECVTGKFAGRENGLKDLQSASIHTSLTVAFPRNGALKPQRDRDSDGWWRSQARHGRLDKTP
jgi:hypothetical protein